MKNKTDINIQIIITFLNIMYPGKFVEVSVHYSSHVTVSGNSQPAVEVWELFVADNYCKEFDSLTELVKFIQYEHSVMKKNKKGE